jgi:hypothetical protein
MGGISGYYNWGVKKEDRVNGLRFESCFASPCMRFSWNWISSRPAFFLMYPACVIILKQKILSVSFATTKYSVFIKKYFLFQCINDTVCLNTLFKCETSSFSYNLCALFLYKTHSLTLFNNPRLLGTLFFENSHSPIGDFKLTLVTIALFPNPVQWSYDTDVVLLSLKTDGDKISA